MVWAPGHELQNGKYVVVGDPLGRGGFGTTYKVRHVQLNAFMVIKTPNEYLKDDPDYPMYVDRFIREGQLMERFSQRSHPNIVRVRDLFKEGDVPCMVMDFVEGEDLFKWVRRKGTLAEAEILPCIQQIGKALDSLHQSGLVHRDAHPGNIMRCEDGTAVLIDFGIAKELVPATQSSTGIAGNRGFAPYEQMFQGSREVTVDIYCLAASLYYAVTGQRPVEAIARKLNNAPLIAPQQHNRKLSAYVNQAILKGMALEAADRPRSMAAWLQLLEVPKFVSPPVQPASPLHRERITTPAMEMLVTRVVSSSRLPSPSLAQMPDVYPGQVTSKKRTVVIPWGFLLVVLTGYFFAGSLLSLTSATLFIWAGSVAIAWAWFWFWAGSVAVAWTAAVAASWIWAVSMVVAVTGVWTMAKTGVWAVSVAGSGSGVWAVAVFGFGSGFAVVVRVVAVTGEALLKSFNRWQTFLILFGVSSAGLGLGWSLRLLFPSGT